MIRVPNLDLDDVQITSDEGDSFILKKTIEADSPNSACQEIEEWEKWFSQALLLLTGKAVIFELKNYQQLDGNLVGMVYSISTILSTTVYHNLKKEEVEMAIKLIPKLAALPSDDLRMRAINWLKKGIQDSDPVDRFISHWIALEALSNIYNGAVNPHTCPKCMHVLKPRPHRGVLCGFLKDHKMQDNIDDAKKIYDIRGDLFHEARKEKEAISHQPKLQDILKQSILETLGGSS